MRHPLLAAVSTSFFLLAPLAAVADPPAHAPAHGYRAKQPKAHPVVPRGGVEIVFDSERGIHVAVGLPGIFFHEGHYYREHEGRWQKSLTGRGDWRRIGSGGPPDLVVKAHSKGRAKRKAAPPAKARGKR